MVKAVAGVFVRFRLFGPRQKPARHIPCRDRLARCLSTVIDPCPSGVTKLSQIFFAIDETASGFSRPTLRPVAAMLSCRRQISRNIPSKHFGDSMKKLSIAIFTSVVGFGAMAAVHAAPPGSVSESTDPAKAFAVEQHAQQLTQAPSAESSGTTPAPSRHHSKRHHAKPASTAAADRSGSGSSGADGAMPSGAMGSSGSGVASPGAGATSGALPATPAPSATPPIMPSTTAPAPTAPAAAPPKTGS